MVSRLAANRDLHADRNPRSTIQHQQHAALYDKELVSNKGIQSLGGSPVGIPGWLLAWGEEGMPGGGALWIMGWGPMPGGPMTG